ncbi:hypothetical protein ACFLYO_06315, partial [Chloroflexota bacterium]
MEKKEIEEAVVRDFFLKQHDYHLNDGPFKLDRENPDAEVRWQEQLYGIEVGAVINQRSLLASIQSQDFLGKANAAIANCNLRKDVRIALVMQDEQ